MKKKPNHLLGQTSPYLLQHLYNPVDWHPWGEEALARARKENKPLLVSIGYSACHWCHVMERESFGDPETADLMNRHFVCVKVDREERPDIDHLYMQAVQLISGRGGWPLNCFALSDGRPFWGGTYFPRQQWMQILERIADLHKNGFTELEEQAERLTRGVSQSSFLPEGDSEAAFARKDVGRMVDNLLEYLDEKEGGTKGAPKFPLPVIGEFLLHHAFYHPRTDVVRHLHLHLEKMAMGGIYDQIGGGFARYATDDRWRVPHFEKMLYDNGQLVSLYARAWKTFPNPLYKEVVSQTVKFAERELMSDDGVFFSALDADSEGEEGRYYVWREEELDLVLGDDFPMVKAYYRVGDKGLWEEDKNILMREEDIASFAKRMQLDPAVAASTLRRAREKLLVARSQRVRPGLDNKVLISWNALMIGGLADAYAAFRDTWFLDLATRAASFLLDNAMSADGRLHRSLSGKTAAVDGFLDDYAFFAQALIRLYEVSCQPRFLHAARTLTAYATKHFATGGTKMYSFSAGNSEKLAAPHYELFDNVVPASNSAMARVLFYLAHCFEEPGWGQRSSEMLRDIRGQLDKHAPSYANWGILLMHHTHPFHSVVVAGEDAAHLAEELAARHIPGTVVVMARDEKEAEGIPVFRNRLVPGKTLMYVCSMGRCNLPVETVDEVLAQLRMPDNG